MNDEDDYTKSVIELKRVTDLIASIEHSHSVFCFKLEYVSIVNMTKKERLQLLKLIEIYMMDCILLVGLSNHGGTA